MFFYPVDLFLFVLLLFCAVTIKFVLSFRDRRMSSVSEAGPVNGLYLFKVIGLSSTDELFKALHLAHTLLTREFVFVVNQTGIQVFIRATSTHDNEILEAASNLSRYNFDDRSIKVIKIAELSLVPAGDDSLRNNSLLEFPASWGELPSEKMGELNYPTGYYGRPSDIPMYKNPRMLVTTMEILGLSDDKQRGLVRAIVMHFFTAKHIAHAIQCVDTDFPFKHAIHQDGPLYMKFVYHEHAERMEKSHYHIDDQMVKFYVVENVFRIDPSFDKATKEVYYKDKHDDWWKPLSA